MSTNASGWRTLTDNQRAGWGDLGAQITRKDSLGQAYTLNGFQAYCSVNNNRLNAGDAVIADAPALAVPTALTGATVTTTAGTLSIAFMPTPLPTATKALLFASGQCSAGVSYQGDYRFIQVSAAAATSPINGLSAYTAKFGAPIAGSKIFFTLYTYFGGFVSGPLSFSKIVTA
jgi:hypothetical protein